MTDRGPRHWWLALLACAALSIVWTWPVAAVLDSRIGGDAGDPLLNLWILWWNAQAVPFTDRWWNAPFMFPLRDTLALSEHLLGLSVVATPLQLAGANPLVAYNVAVILSFTLSGFFAYLLAYRLTGSVLAAACAGLAFGFAPYRAGQLSHVQVLTAQWMPAMLLGMHGYAASGRGRWLVLFGVSWLLQSLSNGYFMLFLPALILPWIAWFTPWRTAPARAGALVGTWVISSLPLVPLLVRYRAVHSMHGLARTLGDIRQFSADPGSFLEAPPLLAFWPAGQASPGVYLFPGLTVVVLAAAGIGALGIRALRATLRRDEQIPRCILFYAGAALLMFVLALGPGGESGDPPSLLHPYSWLLWLPGYDGLRVPARFAMPGVLCLALAAACSLAWFLRGGRWRAAAALAALAGLAIDGFPERMLLSRPPARLMLADAAGAAVIELPVDNPRANAAAMYRAIHHRRPLVNGYTGHTPHLYEILSLTLWRGDTSALRYVARDAPLVIVVNDDADREGRFRRLVEAIPDAKLLHLSAVGPVFLLPQQPGRTSGDPGAADEPQPDTALAATSQNTGAGRIQFDLGAVHTIEAIAFHLRDRELDLPARMVIEISDDGEQWTEGWAGWTGAFALDAALRHPLLTPIEIPVPSIRARYLRVYPAPGWLAEELRVIGR